MNVLSGWTAGVYGTEGVPAAGNIPGSRTGASAWTDTSGNFWLLGGTPAAPVVILTIFGNTIP